MPSVILLFVLLTSHAGICTAQTRCTDNSGCFPSVGNLALGRSINVSSTCDSNSEYCILLSPGPDCFTCLPDSVNSPSSINDNNNDTSWYSEIGPGGVTTSLQIDFEAPVLFQGMTMVWQSARPRTMLLERSQDFGVTWQVYRYYSSSCSDSFMLPDTIVTDSSTFNTTAPVCTSSQSQLLPFSDGLVTFSTSQHLPPEPTDAINYRTVTNLRVQLMDQFIELMVSGQLYQYYSVSEWLIWGSCSCNGHAAVCTPGNGETMTSSKEVYTGCFCEHNTEGNNCEMCQMGFNGALWMPGTSIAANQCQECMCNGHANDCEYNTTQSSAVCLNCTDNTTGNNCELCVPGFYQDETVLLNDPAICIPCGCNQAGIVDDGLCDSSGQCNCKTNVDDTSLSCSQCQDGYWNLTEHNPDGCQVCDCNADGSILAANGLPLCAKETGECPCREGATGSQCEGCMDGFYDISAGCLPCDCNQGGSTSQICDQNSANAQCPCIPNVESTTCRLPAAGYYSKSLDEIIFEAEEATLAGGTMVFVPSPGSTGPFTGMGFISLVSFSSVQFIFTAPKSDQYELIIRFEASSVVESISFSLISLNPVTFDLNCDTTTSMNVSRFNFASRLPQSRYYTVDSTCLSRDVPYQLTVEDTSFTQTGWLVDSLLLLPDFSARSAYYASQNAQDQQTIIEPCLPRQALANPILLPECEEPTFTLSTEFYGSVFACDCGLNLTDCYRYSGSCTCPSGVTGSRCDICIQGMFNLSDSGCLPCDCDSIGSINQICNQDSGNCACQPGVGGRRCDQCLPGFYNFSMTGCTSCQCSEYALLDSCNSEGQCTCPYGVNGLTCDQCQTNFYNISIDGCTPCDCDPAGSSSGACDTTTGQCTCFGSTTGRNCSMCPDGFFRTDGEVRDQCVRCSCMGQTNECVADNESYGLGLVLSNFSVLCQDNPIACDDGWIILTADGEQAAPYGPSNANGLGYILLINHMPMLYAPEKYLGDRLATYGLTFSAFLRISNTGALNVNTTIIRIIGSNFDQELIGIFPPPTVTPNGFGAERYLEYTIQFIEDNWHVGGSAGPRATFAQFVTVLTNLTELSFSAQYTEDIIEFVHIVNISLQTLLPAESFLISTVNFTKPIVPIVYPFPTEDCQCPEAYIGLSCEECNQGFARSTGLPTDSCVRCDCNNQTLDCDPVSEVCLSCQGNSEGDRCERCIPGYYGDPTRSIDCLPCQCPLLNNNFSPTCFLNETDGLPTCDNCAEGYTGRNCEVCMDGYFGSPLMGRCTTCECNGNIDPALGPVCDTTTGQCLNCLNNTAGFECELCLPGYFGDPQTGKSCQPCPCDPGGTLGDCDSLFGTCACQPGATGQLCNECIDGYWGVSQGCIPCDCCTDGTIGGSNVCDKETGACTCKLNVGSDTDDKCCNCTPGYFNFSDQGCQTCNCSALAVSEECDQVTGTCVCQDGARGLKCDDCEYGYIGQVPDCERCHDCFFQWDSIINDLRRRIADLHSQTISLTQLYFSNYTADEILLETNQLLTDLQKANESLNTINLQESSLEELQQTIINLNVTINGYSVQVETIENELVDAQRMLDNAIGYDGTVNMTTIAELTSQLSAVNSTIAREYYTANRTITLILEEQQMITEIWEELNMLNETAQALFVNLSLARNTTEEAEILVQRFNVAYTLLRSNLSSLAVRYNMLNDQIVLISQIASNASLFLENAEADFNSLAADVNTSTIQANSALLKATQLNNTINATQTAAQRTLNSINGLLSLIMNSTIEANSTLNSVGDIRVLTDLITLNLTQIKTVVERILNLSISFSIEEAEALARQINETIISPEVVRDIIRNVTVVKQIANQTLETAMEASASAMEAGLVVQELQGNINSTSATQQQVSESLTLLNDNIQETVEHIQLISNNATEINFALEQAEDIYSNATNSIQFTREVGMNNTARASDILAQATDVENQAQENRNGIEQAIEGYRVIDSRIDAEQVEAESTHNAALDLQTRAEALNAEANQVSLEDLLDLLQRYNDETAQVERLRQQVNQLQQRLQVLTESFERASQRLQRCYKTP